MEQSLVLLIRRVREGSYTDRDLESICAMLEKYDKIITGFVNILTKSLGG